MSAKTFGLSDYFDVKCRDARMRFFKAIPPPPLIFLYRNSKGKTLKLNAWLSNYGKPRALPRLPILAPLQCTHISHYIKEIWCFLTVHARALKINCDKQILFFWQNYSDVILTMVDGTKFWFSCQQIAFLSSLSRLQLIQKTGCFSLSCSNLVVQNEINFRMTWFDWTLMHNIPKENWNSIFFEGLPVVQKNDYD